MLRQSLVEAVVKWVKSEQLLADVLTKMLSQVVMHENYPVGCGTWTLGPDDRATSIRGRRLWRPTSSRASSQRPRMVRRLRERKTPGNDIIAEDEHEISTILAEPDATKNETAVESYFVTTLVSEESSDFASAIDQASRHLREAYHRRDDGRHDRPWFQRELHGCSAFTADDTYSGARMRHRHHLLQALPLC